MSKIKSQRPLLSAKRGFTLVELLVVMAIIAILSVTAYVALGGQTAKARNSRRQQDVSAVQSALEIYFVENFSKYPTALHDDGNGATGPELEPKYMPKLPTDPVPGHEYTYEVDSVTKKTYQLATTFEQDDGTLKAYVTGNSTTPLIKNGFDASCVAKVCDVVDGSTTCLPYCP